MEAGVGSICVRRALPTVRRGLSAGVELSLHRVKGDLRRPADVVERPENPATDKRYGAF